KHLWSLSLRTGRTDFSKLRTRRASPRSALAAGLPFDGLCVPVEQLPGRVGFADEQERRMAVPGLVVGLSLGSALAFAASTNLKHSSAAELPDVHRFRAGAVARFAAATLSHRLWLAGILTDGIGLSLQVLALHLGALAVVQPLLISGLLFALLLRRRQGRPVTAHEVRWALVLTGCLVAFLFLVGTNPAGPDVPGPDRLGWSRPGTGRPP